MNSETPISTLIVGGSVAGIAAASALQQAGHRVSLFEAKASLGGRYHSQKGPKKSRLDTCIPFAHASSPHLKRLLGELGSKEGFRSYKTLHLPFHHPRWGHREVALLPLPFPLRFLSLASGLPFLSSRQRWHLLRALTFLKSDRWDALRMTVWCRLFQQDKALRDFVWQPLMTLLLGQELHDISVLSARQVLKPYLFGPVAKSALAYPATYLSDLFDEGVQTSFQERQIDINFESKVTRLVVKKRRIAGLVLQNGKRLMAKRVILALPPDQLRDLLPEVLKKKQPYLSRLDTLGRRERVMAYVFPEQNVSLPKFSPISNSVITWVYNRQRMWQIPSSKPCVAMRLRVEIDWTSRSDADIKDLLVREIGVFFPQLGDVKTKHMALIRERPTIISFENMHLRAPVRTALKGCFLAGAWTDTGHALNLEGEVASGYQAAQALIDDYKQDQLAGEERAHD